MTDREILEAAKEGVVIKMKYDNWDQLTDKATPLFMTTVLDQCIIIALQKQREQIKTELREKIEDAVSEYEMSTKHTSLESYNLRIALNKILELLKTL